MVQRFDNDTLKDIQQTMPLEISTTNRLIQAILGKERNTGRDS